MMGGADGTGRQGGETPDGKGGEKDEQVGRLADTAGTPTRKDSDVTQGDPISERQCWFQDVGRPLLQVPRVSAATV
ncbi:hypothetical protein CPLU01_01721 [Colletotrichum plurivorum]|uniref:Uncharacterized protein n=1 Tax=Colletotrichum plurivorum TaxID=2175906 RepID=A0A8H6NN52_9PEZI|nr:hypothetical protein CPLU01_01721 [Colletotrichum plurivorum]